MPPTLTLGSGALTPFTPADVPALVAACTEASAVSSLNVPQPYTRADAEAYVDRAQREEGGYFWAIRDAGELLGMIALRFEDTRTADLGGLYLSPRARGRGLATRAAHAVAKWAFENGFDTLEYECLVDNGASVALALRLGFTFTAHGVSRSVFPHHVGKAVWLGRMQKGELREV